MSITERVRRDAVVDCARKCEHALAQADEAQQHHHIEQEAFWRERAEWWSAQAFQEART